MKIELIKNKVYFNNGSEKKEIHPFWLRERVNGEEYLDKGTQQRLFDPTFLSNDISTFSKITGGWTHQFSDDIFVVTMDLKLSN